MSQARIRSGRIAAIMGGIVFKDRKLKYTLTRMAFLLAEKASCRGVLSPQWPQNQRRCTPFRPACKSAGQLCRCSSSSEGEAKDLDRRAVLLGASTVAAALVLQQSALADGEAGLGESKVFWGLARPPTSYGAYSGGDEKNAKYAFDYPASWKVETVGKNEKGMQGIDCRVRNKIKGQSAYTVTFGRAGEDNKSFRLGDVDQTLQGFAGADYDLQDALVESTNKSSSKAERHGQNFYDYELAGPGIQYLATVTERGGKVYAFFVKSPTKNFVTDEATLRSIVQSFRLV